MEESKKNSLETNLTKYGNENLSDEINLNKKAEFKEKEDIENLIKNVEKTLIKRKNTIIKRSIHYLIVLVTLTMVSVINLMVFTLDSNKFVEKLSLQSDIEKAIANNSTLDDLKIVFKHRALPTNNLSSIIKPSEYYSLNNLTLQDVLEDIKTSILIDNKGNVSDSDNKNNARSSIDKILSDYAITNPFEGLDEEDKKELRNISLKVSPETYESIKPEITSITESLKNKNSLIREYLNSSNLSLYISTFALLFSIVIGIWPFLPKAKETQKQIIIEAIKDHFESKIHSNNNIDDGCGDSPRP